MVDDAEVWKLVRDACFSADECGLLEPEVHRLVSEAFREAHQSCLERLDEAWDREFARLQEERQPPPSLHVQQIGGDSMSKPLKEFACGSVRATIWENLHGNGSQEFATQTIRVERRYRDENGEWQSTNGFRKNELPQVELVVRKAFEFLSMREREPQEADDGASPEA